MPRYLFIYFKISFAYAQTVEMIEQKVAYNIIIQGTTILDQSKLKTKKLAK